MTDFHVFIYVNSNKDDTNENPFNIQSFCEIVNTTSIKFGI